LSFSLPKSGFFYIPRLRQLQVEAKPGWLTLLLQRLRVWLYFPRKQKSHTPDRLQLLNLAPARRSSTTNDRVKVQATSNKRSSKRLSGGPMAFLLPKGLRILFVSWMDSIQVQPLITCPMTSDWDCELGLVREAVAAHSPGLLKPRVVSMGVSNPG
jgi:hypothetical protein